MKRWVRAEALAALCKLQQDTPQGISSVLRTGLGAYRLHRAIGTLLADATAREQAEAALAKCDPTKWFSLEGTLQLASRQQQLAIDDPFTSMCVAAYKQLRDLQALLQTPAAADVEKIRARHEGYAAAQVAGIDVEARA